MISIDLWRARIGQFNSKCSFGSSLYYFSLLFDPHFRLNRKKDPSQKDEVSSPTTAASINVSVTQSPGFSNNSPTKHSSASTSPASFSSASSTSCSIKSTLSSWLSVLFSFLPSCSLSYSSGVCRSVLRETPLIILLIAGIISHQLIICAGDVETNPGPIASDRPRTDQLIFLKKEDSSKLQVLKWITSHEMWQCENFANMLLKDDIQVRRYRNDCKGKDEFVHEVLRDWLSRDDGDSTDSAVPRTWSALAECVSDAGLDGALAKAIRDTCPSPAGAAGRTVETDSPVAVNMRADHISSGGVGNVNGNVIQHHYHYPK